MYPDSSADDTACRSILTGLRAAMPSGLLSTWHLSMRIVQGDIQLNHCDDELDSFDRYDDLFKVDHISIYPEQPLA